MTAKQRYDRLSSSRSQFLNAARQASELTIPYLIREDEHTTKGALKLTTPWQSTGAKGVVTLASKLMLALLPPQTSFFKLQVNDVNLPDELGPEIRSELDLSFAKIERTVMESIAESGDRVVVHQALKHLVVAGNALIFMSKDGLKLYPLNRYVVDRDGNGNVIEIVTKETISKKLIKKFYPEYEDKAQDSVVDDGHIPNDECVIYTHVKLDNNRWVWHQELEGKILPKSMGKAPFDANPWLVLRFNHVDGEVYGRGRVEEFLGDLKSLEALSQAIVEGSAAAAKVVFTVSPSSTTKPQTLAKAGNGAIIQGRPEDIGVVQVGKTADFSTAYQMIGSLTQRLNEAFLILNVRDSERTTAEEVRMTQLELEQQLGGLFSLLTVEFLVPYLNRKLNVAQKTGDIPRLPQGGIVRPTIVAGINALGRGQDRESLAQFLTVIAQTMGPDAIAQYINPDEVIKRLAASSGIDVLNLVKSMQELQAEQQQQMQQQQAMMAQQQAPQMAAVAQKADAAQMQAAQQAQEQQLPPQ
ncbi:head tail connector protein [uncultured phage MedDCM-OCT-S04-C24]|uniref:Head tail connector protein n=1 Tax=uncultured phage MedDCM-OCT-S04-C24 TaxID=743543 RepID=D6PH04_9CAUD|nr:head-tail adaptor [uncultured phage MedDCM-OCT-S04-C24]ADD95005.1 head tail connector protein [uncultured phage MedDCM-OCT-S04-C24]